MRLQTPLRLVVCASLAWLFGASPLTVDAAGAPGGILETSSTAQTRNVLSRTQIRNLLPNRGRFNFPAPYDTEAFRLTNPSDCGGSDCVHHIGYSYWRNTNNHVGQNRMLILVGLDRNRGGAGPSLFAYDKRTNQVSALGPAFDANDARSWASGEGMYFSGTRPNDLYITNNSRLLRYDVIRREYETVFDVGAMLGNGYLIWQAHSSDDDRVHSATLKADGSYSNLGCVVYREAVNDLTFFERQGEFDECQIDRSGKWLVIKENVDGQAGEDNRIIDVETLEERVLLDQNGAGGHSDMGHGYMIAADNWDNLPNTQLLWKFDEYPLRGTRVYHGSSWSGSAPNHVSHTNSIPGVSLDNQYACGSSANQQNFAHANEIICFKLSGTTETLVVAPVMVDLNASGGGDYYGKLPKGNLDVTGQYFIWSSNMRSDRLDVFMVKVPGHKLTGEIVSSLPPEIDVIFKHGFEQ